MTEEGEEKTNQWSYIICHFSFVIREFNLEVQQLLFEKYFIGRFEIQGLARSVI